MVTTMTYTYADVGLASSCLRTLCGASPFGTTESLGTRTTVSTRGCSTTWVVAVKADSIMTGIVTPILQGKYMSRRSGIHCRSSRDRITRNQAGAAGIVVASTKPPTRPLGVAHRHLRHLHARIHHRKAEAAIPEEVIEAVVVPGGNQIFVRNSELAEPRLPRCGSFAYALAVVANLAYYSHMKSYVSHSLEETAAIAQEIIGVLALRSERSSVATVVGLSGHLGAGKTAFTKAAARILGVTEEITSPTFVIMKMYPVTHSIWKKLVHIDAYRLEQGKELVVLKFDELANDPANLIFIEWPENVKGALGESILSATITFSIPSSKENERTIGYVESPTASI